MPFFSDYGYYHGSAPFSSQYYSQLLPYPGSNSSRPISRVQPRNFNSIVVEQTLRAIRRGPGVIAARHYARPVHINASEIDVTSPRRPQRPSTVETVTNDNADGSIHRGRTVVRLHTKNKRTGKLPLVLDEPELMVMTTLPENPACMSTVSEEGLAKKGTIKRHTSAGIKVPANDDRRPSVTDEILREQEALFDTMIMEEMEVKNGRRKSYPVDIDDRNKKKPQKNRETRKKSIVAGMVFDDREKQAKKTNWKLNYDVIIEESGIEPVSFTFKLNKTKQDSGCINVDNNNGKLNGANHNVVFELHDDNNSNENKNIKKHVKSVNKKQTNNDNSDDVCMSMNKTKLAAKKKIIVKKKVIKKKESGKQEQNKQELQEQQGQQKTKLKTPSPPESKKKGSKTETVAVTTATAVAITPFVRTSFGKTFISPSQVSSTKSKFEKPKPKPLKIEQKSSPPQKLPPPPSDSLSDDDESSSDEDSSSLCSSNSSSSNSSSSTGSSSTYYDSDEYGDKRIACSVSSFDSGLPSSPVPATDPIGRKNNTNV